MGTVILDPEPRLQDTDADSTDGSDAEGQEWVGDAPQRDDGSDETVSTSFGDAHTVSTADETDGPREDNDSTSTPSEGRGKAERYPYRDEHRQDINQRPGRVCPDRRGGRHSPQSPTAEAVKSPTETQTPQEHRDSASGSSDTSTTGSTENSEDTGDTTSDKPPPTTATAG